MPESSSGRKGLLYLDEACLRSLRDKLCLRLEELFGVLDISLRKGGNTYSGPCPVHAGNNTGALNLYEDGHTTPGYWRCYSHKCEDVFKPTVFGFVRGVLSRQKHAWAKPGDRQVTWRETIDWCCSFLGVELASLDGGAAVSDEKIHFARSVRTLAANGLKKDAGLPRACVVKKLSIPDAHFVSRGYSAAVLRRFDVGTCLDASKPFYERAVVPVYDEGGKMAVGFTARSIHPECPACKLHHRPGTACPTPGEEQRCRKWLHSKGMSRESLLYNQPALGAVRGKGVVVLTEGPADVWRLYESGVRIGLALLGSSLSEQQQVLLEKSGAMTVVVATDMDSAGRACAEDIRMRLRRSFHVVVLDLPRHDVGEMTVEETRTLFARWIDTE